MISALAGTRARPGVLLRSQLNRPRHLQALTNYAAFLSSLLNAPAAVAALPDTVTCTLAGVTRSASAQFTVN